MKEKVRHAVAHHFGVNPGLIYPTRPGYFSALTSKNPVTPLDKYWLPNIDYVSNNLQGSGQWGFIKPLIKANIVMEVLLKPSACVLNANPLLLHVYIFMMRAICA